VLLKTENPLFVTMRGFNHLVAIAEL